MADSGVADDSDGAGHGAVATVAVAEQAPPQARQPGWVRPVTAVLAALAVVAAVGSVVEVYLIGESGAKAVWQGQFDPNAHPKHRVGG